MASLPFNEYVYCPACSRGTHISRDGVTCNVCGPIGQVLDRLNQSMKNKPASPAPLAGVEVAPASPSQPITQQLPSKKPVDLRRR
jgi:hypothetical protein